MATESNAPNAAKALMAANRLKRQLDRLGIPCPPLSELASPKPDQIGALKKLLNQCMAGTGELPECAETLWDVLGLTGALESAPSHPSKADSIETTREKLASLAQEKNQTKPKAEEPQKPAKKGFFGWLAPEQPSQASENDDDDDDTHYKGGLR